jgi:hypothetical protein
MDTPSWLSEGFGTRPAGTRSVVGGISGTQLRARKRIWPGNSFQTHLWADLIEDRHGTLVQCRFSKDPTIILFVAFFLSVLVLVCGSVPLLMMPLLLSSKLQATAWAWIYIASPLLALVICLAIIWFGYRRARNERQLLIDFLRSTISADQRAAPNITASLTS